MFDLEQELRQIVEALDGEQIEYALCGGLALVVHGYVRATIDIDLLVRGEDLERIENLANDLGYKIKARPMHFSQGAVEIRRISKIDPNDGETLMLDLLLVTDANRHVWETRHTLPWGGRDLWVVSREGLITLKMFRASEQDLLDIRRLREEQ
jgi:hypothetical protein